MANHKATTVLGSGLSGLVGQLNDAQLSYEFRDGRELCRQEAGSSTVTVFRSGASGCRVSVLLGTDLVFDEDAVTLGVQLSEHHPFQRMTYDPAGRMFVCEGQLTSGKKGALSFVATDTRKSHRAQREKHRLERKREGYRQGLFAP